MELNRIIQLSDLKDKGKELAAIIRHVRPRDLMSLSHIYPKAYGVHGDIHEYWRPGETYQMLSYFYNNQKDLFFVAEYKGEIVGAGVMMLKPWWDGGHLIDGELFVDPNFQGKGVGRQLLRRVLSEGKRKYGAVSCDTVTFRDKYPLRWYKRVGFEESRELTLINGDIDMLLERLNKS